MRKTIYSKQNELVAEAIKKMRERAGVTSRELSRRLGKGHSFISNCEQGQRRVDLSEFYWICDACGEAAKDRAFELMESFSKLK